MTEIKSKRKSKNKKRHQLRFENQNRFIRSLPKQVRAFYLLAINNGLPLRLLIHLKKSAFNEDRTRFEVVRNGCTITHVLNHQARLAVDNLFWIPGELLVGGNATNDITDTIYQLKRDIETGRYMLPHEIYRHRLQGAGIHRITIRNLMGYESSVEMNENIYRGMLKRSNEIADLQPDIDRNILEPFELKQLSAHRKTLVMEARKIEYKHRTTSTAPNHARGRTTGATIARSHKTQTSVGVVRDLS